MTLSPAAFARVLAAADRLRELEGRRVSPRRLRELGWDRHDDGQALGVSYTRVPGWALRHCGHPTATRPWILVAPGGQSVGTGVLQGDPAAGSTWPCVAQAVELVHVLDPLPELRPGLAPLAQVLLPWRHP